MAKWYVAKGTLDRPSKGNYNLSTKFGRVVVSKDQFGGMDIHDPKTTAILDKIAGDPDNVGNTIITKNPRTGAESMVTFIGFGGTRDYAPVDTKLVSITQKKADADAAEVEYLEA